MQGKQGKLKQPELQAVKIQPIQADAPGFAVRGFLSPGGTTNSFSHRSESSQAAGCNYPTSGRVCMGRDVSRARNGDKFFLAEGAGPFGVLAGSCGWVPAPRTRPGRLPLRLCYGSVVTFQNFCATVVSESVYELTAGVPGMLLCKTENPEKRFVE